MSLGGVVLIARPEAIFGYGLDSDPFVSPVDATPTQRVTAVGCVLLLEQESVYVTPSLQCSIIERAELFRSMYVEIRHL